MNYYNFLSFEVQNYFMSFSVKTIEISILKTKLHML